MATEKPLSSAKTLFVGKTIERMDARCCNNVQFLFTDGSRVALHIDCNGNGLPVVLACTECATIKPAAPKRRVDSNRGRELYNASTLNDPYIHSNRFPAWEELGREARKEWNAKADAARSTHGEQNGN